MEPELVLTAPLRDLGGGFVVRRALPAPQRRMVSWFTFLDQMGPVKFAPGQGLDVRPHPHIGLATVTYLFEGEFLHRDTLGHEQVIQPGAINWMTAGRGIAHSERTPPALRKTGSRIHGLQIWVALPTEHEEVEPDFHHHPADTLPSFEDDGVKLRVLDIARAARAKKSAPNQSGRIRRGCHPAHGHGRIGTWSSNGR